jgi:NAD(P)-dependent dehydrogenase (short-subunit alcohol dehydrogenase family)
VVNISSVTSQAVLPNRLAYGTTKAALDHFTRSLAVEWGPDGIRVNGVLPWVTRTEMVKRVLEDAAFEQDLIAAMPLGRLAEPADVARVVDFLASPDSAYVTGQLIAVAAATWLKAYRQDRSHSLLDIWRNDALNQAPNQRISPSGYA